MIRLDKSALATPGLPTAGSNPALVYVKRGNIDLSPIFDSHIEDARATMLLLCGMGDYRQVPLVHFCKHLERTGRKAAWLWRHILVNIGNMIENSILDSSHSSPSTALVAMDPSAEADDVQLLATRHEVAVMRRTAKWRKRMRILKAPARDDNSSTLQYFRYAKRVQDAASHWMRV